MTKKMFVPRAERVAINLEFKSIEHMLEEHVQNLSRSGVFLRSQKPLNPGTKVTLKFTLIMDDVETIEAKGEVVRVSEDPPGMGVMFTELSEASQDLIARLMTQRTRRGKR